MTRSEVGTSPVIAINLWAFCSFFDGDPLPTLFGGRLNRIRDEFESYLQQLTNAGAKLIFLFPKPPSNSEERSQVWNVSKTPAAANATNDADVHHNDSMYQTFFDTCDVHTTAEVARMYDNRFAPSGQIKLPLNQIIPIVLCQAAAKYGEFHGNDLFLIQSSAGHAEVANLRNVFAIIGENSDYLCYEGSWKFWQPIGVREQAQIPQQPFSMLFREYNKQAILEHHDFNYEEMQIFILLFKKFRKLLDQGEDEIALRNRTNFNNLRYFVKDLDLPLNEESLRAIVTHLYGQVEAFAVENIVKSLKAFKASKYNDENRFTDENINQLIKNTPVMFAERILNKCLLSANGCNFQFLRVNPDDHLILPWIQRTMGLLLKDLNGTKTRKYMIRGDTGELNEVEIEPKYPTFQVPSLRQLLVGDFDDSLKMKILLFMVDNVIDEQTLKFIPKEFLIHAILMVHLVKVTQKNCELKSHLIYQKFILHRKTRWNHSKLIT